VAERMESGEEVEAKGAVVGKWGEGGFDGSS
jgi:hypothetical protein